MMKKLVGISILSLVFTGLVLLAPTFTARAQSGSSEPDLEAMQASAKTPEDHAKLAEAYKQDADAATKKAAKLQRLAKAYAQDPVMGSSLAASETKKLAKHYQNVAASDLELAKVHQEAASKATKP
jgi:hypothetical protein